MTYGPASGRGASGRSAQAGRLGPRTGRPDHPRRPALLGKVALDSIGGVARPGPAGRGRPRDGVAAGRVRPGRRPTRPPGPGWCGLVDDLGLDTVAELWADRPARSLPGALWRLYALREWVRATRRRGLGRLHRRPVGRGRCRTWWPARPTRRHPRRCRCCSTRCCTACSPATSPWRWSGPVRSAGSWWPAGPTGPTTSSHRPAGRRALTRRRPALHDTAEDLEAAAALWRTHDLV